jgi:hypothetical protein
MKLFATGATEAATIGIFWPELLPEDFDQRLEDGKVLGQLEQLAQEELLIQCPCDADGQYTLGVWIDEPLPPELVPVAHERRWLRKQRIVGDTKFGGLEYAFKDETLVAAKYRALCGSVAIPPGDYEATLYETEVPDDVYEAWLVDKSSPAAKRLWDVQSWFAACGVVGMFVFVGALFFGTRSFMLSALTIALSLSAIGYLLSRLPGYRAVQQARQSYEATFPDYVLKLDSLPQ